MKLIIVIFQLFLPLLVLGTGPQFQEKSLLQNVYNFHNKEIIGYYPNWQWYRRSNLVRPESIFFDKYTVINYAFFSPLSSGQIFSTDPWADENILLGPPVWWPEEGNDYTLSLPHLASQAGVRLLPSIGGWNHSNYFPGIAADPVKRQTFVQACVDLIETYGFDGIDLDWEYPGYAPHNGSPADTDNFTVLLEDLRTALDSLEVENSREYLLTSCFGASESHMSYIDWESVIPLIDMVNLMSYDFHGPWDVLSNHHTPLYPVANGDPDWCVDGAFTLLIENFNVPAEKINIGIAFYGKALANCSELNGTHSGYDSVTFPLDEGQPHYYTILENLHLFDYLWDEQVKCPYLLGQDFDTFVTYDNELSVNYKAQYIMDNNAMGTIIWEITGDYTETYPGSGMIEGTPLLDEIISVFSVNNLLPPSDLNAGIVDKSIHLTWIEPFSGSSGQSDLMGYNLYKNDALLNDNLILESSFLDTEVSVGSIYIYFVTAVYDEGESLPSDSVEIIFLLPPLELSAVPGNTTVELNWKEPTGLNFREISLEGFNVYRDDNIVNNEVIDGLSYLDTGLLNGVTYTYHVTALYGVGESPPSNQVEATPQDDISVEKNSFCSGDKRVISNYPNPFNPATTIFFFMEFSGYAEVTVYNSKGQKVRTLLSQTLDEGQHFVEWDGRDKDGEYSASGVYMYEVMVEGQRNFSKMLYLK